MPGLVAGEQAFGFHSLMRNPALEIASATPVAGSEEAERASSAIGYGHPPLPVLLYHAASSSNSSLPSADKASPTDQKAGARDERKPKVFATNLPKLGRCDVIPIGMLSHGASGVEGLLSDARGDASIPSGFFRGIISPMGRSPEHSCGSGRLAGGSPPVLPDAMSAWQRFLPSNNEDTDSFPALDANSSDEFRMYEFKVRRCMRGRSHDWTECPFAHPGEKARRRDPRVFHYLGTACPDFRKGSCRRGDGCEFAHGVFECWLHPARYRTQPCKDGTNCKRRVCFFAHSPAQLRFLAAPLQESDSVARIVPHSSPMRASVGASYDGLPLRQAVDFSLDSSLASDNHQTGAVQTGFVDGTWKIHLGSPGDCHLGFICKPGLPSASLQSSSPTSTLLGHSISPPALSPSTSPPASPNSPHSCSANLARTSSCVSCPAALSSLSHLQASITACVHNSGSMPSSAMVTPVASSLLSSVPTKRCHIDGLHTGLSFSIPSSFECIESFSMNSPASVSVAKIPSSSPMNGVKTTLQQLNFTTNCTNTNYISSPSWSSPLHVLHNVPVMSMKNRWGCQIDQWGIEECGREPSQRVESGQYLRAKIYGKLCKGNPLEYECPDLGWVNELVK